MKTLTKFILRILLLIIAVAATSFFSLISLLVTIIYYLGTLKLKKGVMALSDYVYQIALSVDQLGNVTCQEVFNLVMVNRKKHYHPFGEEDDTISYIIAKNQERNTLSGFGRFWAWFLDFVDPKDGGHLYKTLQMKKKKDFSACLRVNKE